uniref:S8 family serine peptidase n=1 Tax=Anabaena sp. CCY 9402-a TaxID=3103867 RepID=UPI0039C6E328
SLNSFCYYFTWTCVYTVALAGESGHATSVAGVIGAAAGNGIGGVGVAYGSTLASFRFNYGNDDSLIRALQRLRNVDVANNSWGSTSIFGADFLNPGLAPVVQAIRDAVQFGRNGLGTASGQLEIPEKRV